MTSSRVSFESSPFHLVPCSPYIGTTISAISLAVRAVPEVAETADVFVADSPRSVAGQDVPQTPVFHIGSGSSNKQNERIISPHNAHRVATPEQEVPKTPMQSDSSATKKKPTLILKIKTKTNTSPPRRDDAKQINFFHGDDEDIFD